MYPPPPRAQLDLPPVRAATPHAPVPPALSSSAQCKSRSTRRHSRRRVPAPSILCARDPATFHGNTERRLPDLRPSTVKHRALSSSRGRDLLVLLDPVSLAPAIHAIPRAIATSTIGALTPFKEMAKSHSIVDATFRRQRPKSSAPAPHRGRGTSTAINTKRGRLPPPSSLQLMLLS